MHSVVYLVVFCVTLVDMRVGILVDFMVSMESIV